MPYYPQCWRSAKTKLIYLDNERLAIGAVTFIGVGLLIPILILTPELIESFNPTFLFEILAQYGSFIAGGAYLGRFVNIMTACLIEVPPLSKKTQVTTVFNDKVLVGRPILGCEKTLTPIGMLLGASLAIACIVLHCTVPYLSVFSYFAYVLFALGGVCTVGGLFNRIGSSCDGTRLDQEKKTILVGSILGILLAVALIIFLCLTGTLPFVAVAGVTKVFFGLFAKNKTLFILMGGLTLISVTTSCFDYLAKSYCFLKYRFQFGAQDACLETRLSTRYHEYQGAFLGGVTACLVIIAISTALFLSGVFIGAAPWVIGATLLLIGITCLSVIAALFSRIGRFIDGIQRSTPTTAVLSPDQFVDSERLAPDSVDKVKESHDLSFESEKVLSPSRPRSASDSYAFFRSQSNLIKMSQAPNLSSRQDRSIYRTPEEDKEDPSRTRSHSICYDPSFSFFGSRCEASILRRTNSIPNLANYTEKLGQQEHNLTSENESITSNRLMKST